MKKETLKIMKAELIEFLDKLAIDDIDRVELMINLPKFLDNYDENIKRLQEGLVKKYGK